MRHEVTVVTDDLDGSEGAQTILFAIDGRAFQIDLSDDNAQEMRQAFAKYTEAGRLVGRGTGTPLPGKVATSKAMPGRNDPAFVHRVKDWAKNNGHKVPNRGRVPNAVVNAYRASGGV